MKAEELQEGFSRSIIGFDLREKSLICEHDASKGLSHKNTVVTEKCFPATIESQVWPNEIKDELNADRNGFNLFDMLEEVIELITYGNDMLLVAFEIPEELADELTTTFGLRPISIEMVLYDKIWKFLGYDVVDIRTQCSAMYSFDYEDGELEQIFHKHSLKLNPCGLVQSESDAINASVAFDKIIPEHSPFSPCGVWVKTS